MTYVAQYNRVVPCSECPFRKSGCAVRLSPERVEEIIGYQGQFPCHKTIDYDEETGDGRPRSRAHGGSSVCAGSILFHLNSGNPPLSLRLAVAMGMVDLDKYRDPKLRACVVDGPEEMILGGIR